MGLTISIMSNCMTTNMINGEKSMPEIVGMRRRTGRDTGSLMV